MDTNDGRRPPRSEWHSISAETRRSGFAEGLHLLTTRELPLASENRRVGIRVEIRRYDDLRFFCVT